MGATRIWRNSTSQVAVSSIDVRGHAPHAGMIEAAARNERRIVLCGIAVVAMLGLYLTIASGDALMMRPVATGIIYAALLFVMWWTMMMAMMLPSAAPAILLFGALSRKLSAGGGRIWPMLAFAAGYMAIWSVFSLAATLLQLVARRVMPLTGMFAVTSALAGGLILVLAGLYQFTALKYACLRKCRTPLTFFARNWRTGTGGAFHMGLDHGLFCVGCCWVLMGLLFYGGVMDLSWILGLAVFIAAEKLIPSGRLLTLSSGLALLGWGLWIVAATLAPGIPP